MKPSLLGWILVLLAPIAHADHESKGGEVFEIGGAVKLFDRLERDQVFSPEKLEEFKLHIEPILKIIKSKLPRTGQLIQGSLTKGIRPRWYFVKFKLKDIPSGGDTALVLTYEKMQVAANNGSSVQIEESLWKKMEPIDRAWLLVHEALWVAFDLKSTPHAIRNMTSLLFHEKLATFSPHAIAEEFRNGIQMANEVPEDTMKKSPLQLALDADTGKTATNTKSPVPDGWENLSVSADGVTPAECLDENDQCAFFNHQSQLYWSERNPDNRQNLSESQAENGCVELRNWGGNENWRLPSHNEVNTLYHTEGFPKIQNNFPHFGVNNWNYWTTRQKSHESTFFVAVNLFTFATRWVRESAELAWRCVTSYVKPKWQDASTLSDGVTKTPCRVMEDQCAFRDEKTGLIWSERSPEYSDEEDTKMSLDQHSCPTVWAGVTGWRKPTAPEVRAALKNHLSQLALRMDGFGDPNASFIMEHGRYEIFPEDFTSYPHISYWGRATGYTWQCVTTGETPVSPEGDDDGDGVKNVEDKCPHTRPGDTAHKDGEWAGCAGGQIRGTGRYKQ